MENTNVTVMDQFVSTMKTAFLLANNIEGIDSIEWSIKYSGTTSATNEIAKRINGAMEEAGMNQLGLRTNNKYGNKTEGTVVLKGI